MAWGYVEGGMGVVSFAIAEAAAEARRGARRGRARRRDPARRGGRARGRRADPQPRSSSPTPTRRSRSVCSATPRQPAFRSRIDAWRMTSPVHEGQLRARPAARLDGACPARTGRPARRCRSRCRIDDAQAAFEACTRGDAEPGFAELYFQTAYDPTRRPDGQAHDERVRAVRARTSSPTALGHAAATRSAGRCIDADRPLRTATSSDCVD